jgi:hypothetical protein
MTSDKLIYKLSPIHTKTHTPKQTHTHTHTHTHNVHTTDIYTK